MTICHVDDLLIETILSIAKDDNDIGIIENTICRFIKTSSSELEEIELRLENLDTITLEKKVHFFKTSCGVVGAIKALELCEKIEILIKTNNVEEAKIILIKLKEEVTHVKVLLNYYLKKINFWQ